MSLQDPQQIIDRIDTKEFDSMRQFWTGTSLPLPSYSEPNISAPDHAKTTESNGEHESVTESEHTTLAETIVGNVQRFGDNVDTDSIIPTDKCHSHLSTEEVARGAFCYTRPEFYDRSQAGATIIVAEKSFGCGSSREQAPKALIWAGIRVVIAKSFAFIYQRNQVNTGLLGIKLQDEEFYRLAQEGEKVVIDVGNRTVSCAGSEWSFELDPIQEHILAKGGLLAAYELYGRDLLPKLQALISSTSRAKKAKIVGAGDSNRLDW
jgi:homoaconitate hydratase